MQFFAFGAATSIAIFVFAVKAYSFDWEAEGMSMRRYVWGMYGAIAVEVVIATVMVASHPVPVLAGLVTVALIVARLTRGSKLPHSRAAASRRTPTPGRPLP